MIFSVEQIKKVHQTTTRWSGGTTTQLAIWPKDSVYSERNFTWRISSAVVEDETSEFTKLPGYWRYLMVLDGELDLEHQGHHSKHLAKYNVDSFSGHWHTTSTGKVRDFNLMHNVDCSGGMSVVALENDESQILGADYREMKDLYGRLTEAYYGTEGTTLFLLDQKEYRLEEGDLILVATDSLNYSFKVRADGSAGRSAFVRAHILQR